MRPQTKTASVSGDTARVPSPCAQTQATLDDKQIDDLFSEIGSNELKLDILDILSQPALQITYEKINDPYSSFGADVFLNFNENISNSPCSFIFGEVGTDAQHSFFQALHQSTLSFTGDLICFSNNLNSEFCIFDDYDKINSRDLKNFAISQYLAFKNGSDKSIESVHHHVKGNKPVDLFMFNT